MSNFNSNFRSLIHVVEVLEENIYDTENDDLDLQRSQGYQDLQRMSNSIQDIITKIVHNCHTSLNNSVDTLSSVMTKFESAQDRVQSLRDSVSQCKVLLTRGLSEQSLRKLWIKKKKFSFALELLEIVETLRVFEYLIFEYHNFSHMSHVSYEFE